VQTLKPKESGISTDKVDIFSDLQTITLIIENFIVAIIEYFGKKVQRGESAGKPVAEVEAHDGTFAGANSGN
jgi:hypothetical protein